MRGNKIVVSVVGYGYWGPNLVRNYFECPNCIVKYVCDKCGEKLAKAKSRYPSLKCTQNYEEILRDPEVDAVIIATPISTHYHLAKKALLIGKHVFVEKPLADNSSHGEELIKFARRKGLTLMVGHTFVYSPPVTKTKEIIDRGELGEIHYITSSRVNLGLHQSDVSVIWDLAPHDFSILFYWLDEAPEEIHAHGRGCVKPDLPDVAFINLKFPSGVVASVQLSWLSPVKLRRTLVVGGKKMLVYDDTEPVEKVKIFDHGVEFNEPQTFGEFQLSYRTGDITSPRLENKEPLFIEANHFLECIREGKKPRTDGESGLLVLRALELADKSLKLNGGYKEGRRWAITSAPI
jgi:predicted dehydrogenase